MSGEDFDVVGELAGQRTREGPLRVALLHPTYWPEVRRGSERFIRDLADGLLARGHAPTLITSHPGRPRRTVEDGLMVIRNWRPPDGRLRRRMFDDHLTHVPFSYLSLRAGSFDVAHALYPTDALAASRWRAHTGRPAVMSYMGIPHRRSLASRRRRLELTVRAFHDCSAVVVLSEAAAAASERWLGVSPRVIPPGVDLAAFTPGAVGRTGVGAERAAEPTFVCAAAVDVPRKRVALLIEAFALVRRRHADARLILSRPRPRPGPGAGSVAGSVAGFGDAVPAGVELADLDDRAALAAAYRQAWVSVLPSVGEAFGLVLAEALACGTPGVGTRDGGIPEVLDRPEIGRLFEGEEPEALAAAMLEALEIGEDPRTAGVCRARAEELSVDRCVESYVALYRELGGLSRLSGTPPRH